MTYIVSINKEMEMIEAGQIYRDTYYDDINDGKQSHRTIRLVRIENDKAHAETITDVFGRILEKPRKTRVSFKTLASGYERVA